MTDRLRIVVIAGEASGDNLGGPLMQALSTRTNFTADFSGIGGPRMEAAGLKSLFPMTDLSVMGLAEILPKIALLRRRIRQAAELIVETKPDVVITIDAPDFCYRVAKKAQRQIGRGALWVHYVAPTVWAWRPGRARKLARLYDAVLCLLPFEPPYFEREGMQACFVGHPATQEIGLPPDGREFRRRYSIMDDAFVLGLLFGSRVGEVARVADTLVQAVNQAMASAPSGLQVVALTLPHLENEVRARMAGLTCAWSVVVDDKRGAFAAMDAAVAVSGTVGLELALSGVPHVIAYRLNAVTSAIVRRAVRVRYAHLANILLDREVVPEFLQDDCRPERIAGGLAALFDREGVAATAQRAAFAQVRRMLGEADASEVAADFILTSLRQKSRRAGRDPEGVTP